MRSAPPQSEVSPMVMDKFIPHISFHLHNRLITNLIFVFWLFSSGSLICDLSANHDFDPILLLLLFVTLSISISRIVAWRFFAYINLGLLLLSAIVCILAMILMKHVGFGCSALFMFSVFYALRSEVKKSNGNKCKGYESRA